MFLKFCTAAFSLKIRGGNIDTCDISRSGQKTTQLSGNLYYTENPFLVVFHVYENSGPSREVYVDFGLVTTVNEESTQIWIIFLLNKTVTKIINNNNFC
jgi:hypothetical protein